MKVPLILVRLISHEVDMRTFLAMVFLMSSISLADAGPKEDAQQVVAKWSKAFTDGDVDAIARL
jgi:hypothetical protein